MFDRLSAAISWVLHPFLQPLYLIAVMLTLTVYANYPADIKLYIMRTVVLYALVIPLLALGILKAFGRISSYRVDNRHERLLPLFIGSICYIICALAISHIPAAQLLYKMMVAASACNMMCLVVSLYWKISLHLTAIGGVVAMLVVAHSAGVGRMTAPLVVALLCAGVLASARLYLGCHNGAQILAGFIGGFATAFLTVMFLM